MSVKKKSHDTNANISSSHLHPVQRIRKEKLLEKQRRDVQRKLQLNRLEYLGQYSIQQYSRPH